MNSKTNNSSQFPKAYESMKKPKLNIPDLNTELTKDQEMFYAYDTAVQPPPLSTTTCFVNETVNPDPFILRSSMYVIPNTTNGFDSLNIPLGMILTPFTGRTNVLESEEAPLKCRQCFSYVSNFTKVDGNTFYCCLCKEKNTLKHQIDTSLDIFKRPSIELISKSGPEDEVDGNLYVGDAFFSSRVVKVPVFIFVIDLTSPALLEETVKAIVEVLTDSSFLYLYKKISVVLLSHKITILKKESGSILSLDIVNSEAVPFVPPDVFFDTAEATELIDFLEKLQPVKTAPIPPFFNVLLSLSRYAIGSKVALFTQSAFSVEQESLTHQFINNSSSLSVFSTRKGLGVENISTYSMGGIYYYSPDRLYKIKADLHNICTTKSSFGIKVTVKTSNAIRKNAIYANTLLDNLNRVELAQMDSISTICYTFFVDEHVSVKEALYFQFVFDYYAYDGSFRTLVVNARFKTSDKPAEIYSSLSFDTLFACLSKFISSDKKEAATNSKHVEELICKFLSYYRKTCCKEISTSQFVLPETAKLLPLLYQSLIKNKAYSSTLNEIEMRRVTNLTVEQTIRYFYPRLFTLTDFYIQQDLNQVKSLNLTLASLDSSEIYVLENSQKIFLYFGKDVDVSLKEALFNNNEENAILMKMVHEICSNYGYELPIVIVEEGRGGSEVEFIGFMVEDTLNGVPSYHDYICELHFKVQKY